MTNRKSMADEFILSDEGMIEVARNFTGALERRLKGEESSLALLDSCLSLPTGQETGTYLALDFGGTNVRAFRIRLVGKGGYIVEKRVVKPLRKAGAYDHLSVQETKEGLFDFLADCIGEVLQPGESYYLGHTFSFAAAQQGLGDARFVSWSKEVAVSGMEGQHINALLQEALARRGYSQVRPVALVNDTTAVLSAGAYQRSGTQVAAICGTGFNICYFEPALGHIVNLEAGNFDEVRRTSWDIALDQASHLPGNHVLEKLVSGAYLGELFRRCACSYLGEAESALGPCTTRQINEILHGGDQGTGQILMGRLWNRIIPREHIDPLRIIASCLFIRSAQLAGCACAGVLQHLYPTGAVPTQTVAMEGSVIEKVQGSQMVYEDALRVCLGEDEKGRNRPVPVMSELVSDGAAIGAAVAAAVAAKDM